MSGVKRFGAVAALVVIAAACGGGQDPTVEGGAGTTTSTTAAAVAAGDTLPPTGDPAAVDPAAPAGGTPEAPAPTEPVVDPGAGGGGGATAPSGFAPPAAGTYTFHTTGTAPPESLLGPPRRVDEQSVTTITALGPDTVRLTSTVAGGTQTTDLRYEPARVALLLLEVSFGGQVVRFTSAEGVTFAPVPPTEGQTWSGQLRDEGGQLTATFEGASLPVEAITVLGRSVQAFVIDATITITGSYGGFPVDATAAVRAWVDPELRTQVRTHQLTTTRQPVASTSDTTSELVGVTPA